jgi:hypothetical protein
MEAVLILATIAQNFELNVLPDVQIVAQPSITLRPVNGIPVKLRKISTAKPASLHELTQQ